MPRTLIVSPNKNAYSETFIRAHIDHLPHVVGVLTDGALPTRSKDGTPLLDASLPARILRKLRGRSYQAATETAVAVQLRKLRVECVLAEYGTAGAAMAPICTARRIPMVVHFHGIDAFHTKLLREHGDYHQLFASASAIVAVSREMEQQLLALGAPREKLHYNGYGIDVDAFAPVDPAVAGKHFVAVGRFVDKKAPHITLLAFHRAWQRDPELRMTFAGTGPLHGSTVQLAHALGLADVVHFPGAVPHNEVAALMARTRAFVQHSVISLENDHEGTPLSILEAMARALPVIATRHGGIVDVVEHERSGLLVDELDIATMAAHINALADAPERATALGLHGSATIRARHTRAQSIAGLAAIIERTVA